jgi:predicted alpha/beta hydrolase family esterase
MTLLVPSIYRVNTLKHFRRNQRLYPSWSRVIQILEAKDLKVVAVQNPLTSLVDDVAITRRAIDQQTRPVILVGHSWAGVVITEAANNPKVKALVYVAAFAPDNGQSIHLESPTR